jgi:type IV pilus assembly protein PilM
MPIQHLIIAGDCASIPGLASFIQREIGIDTTIADPLSHLQLAPDIDQDNFKRCAPSLIQCSGLALSRVDYD